MYQKVIYFSGGKADISGDITQVFIGTLLSRYHHNMLIWCSIIKSARKSSCDFLNQDGS